jgi:Holliday junction resolvase RusA-like endonuclease
VVDLQLSSDSNRYQRAIARAAHLVIREQITASVRVDLVFVFARPKRLKQGPRALRGVRPDVDKLMRNVFDGLQRDAKGRKPPKRKPATGWPGVLADDSRVVSGTFLDCYAAFGEEPITEIRIVEVSDV